MISDKIRSIRRVLSKKIGAPNKKLLKKSATLRRRFISTLSHNGKIDMSSMKYHAIFLTFFGCGKWKYGPGSLTSLVVTLLWLYISYEFHLLGVETWIETTMWLSFSVILFFYGVFIIPIYSKKLDKEDHPSIVIDEVMGQIVALALSYPFLKPYYFVISDFKINSVVIISHVGLSFMLFRLLDIAKPSIIGKIDREVKGGIGVMLDDLVCGLIVAAFAITLFFICYFIINMEVPKLD